MIDCAGKITDRKYMVKFVQELRIIQCGKMVGFIPAGNEFREEIVRQD